MMEEYSNKYSFKSRIKDPWIIFSLICIFISLILIIMPQIKVFMASMISEDGRFTLDNYKQFFTQGRYLRAVGNSAKVTIYSSVIATVLAVPLAYLLSRYEFKGRNGILTLITMATASPPFLGAYAWIILLGRYGALNRLIFALTKYDLNWGIKGGNGVIWVIIWMIFPLIFLMSYDSFTGEDASHKEAAMSLGANKLKTFLTIEVPLAMPGILTGLLMAALAAFSDFGTPAIIGGEFPVLPTLLYGEFVSEVGGNLSMASTAGIIMVVISTIALVGQRYSLASKTYAAVSVRKFQLIKPSKKVSILIWLYISIIVVMSFAPHITLVIVSFMKWQWGILTNSFTFENYVNLFQNQMTPIVVSYFLGILATFLDFIFGIGIAYLIVRKKYKFVSSFVNSMIMIPYVIPGTVLAVGYIMMFNKGPIVLTGTWIILVLSYFIRKLPYSVKSAEASLYQIHNALEEAAMISGAKPLRAFIDITFKLMIGGIVSGATLSFLQIMTELSSTIILYRPPWVTMPVVIFQNALSSGADFGISASMAVVLMLSVYIPLFFVTKKSRTISHL
jgi:iron(III) transport system permease protein